MAPFSERQAGQECVEKRIERLRQGNFGDCKSLGAELLELRLVGQGIRIYLAEVGHIIVLILWGGGKNTAGDQARDIEKARSYWDEYKRIAREGDKDDG